MLLQLDPERLRHWKKNTSAVGLVPTKYSSEGLIECFEEGKEFSGKKIRIPRTSNATPTLTEKLKEMGADVEEIYVYESGLPVDKKLKDKFYQRLNIGKN